MNLLAIIAVAVWPLVAVLLARRTEWAILTGSECIGAAIVILLWPIALPVMLALAFVEGRKTDWNA